MIDNDDYPSVLVAQGDRRCTDFFYVTPAVAVRLCEDDELATKPRKGVITDRCRPRRLSAVAAAAARAAGRARRRAGAAAAAAAGAAAAAATAAAAAVAAAARVAVVRRGRRVRRARGHGEKWIEGEEALQHVGRHRRGDV